MFRNVILTAGLFVCVGSSAFAFESVPLAPSSHAPAEGPVGRPVDLWIPPEDGVFRRRPPALVSEFIWNKYSKRPSAFTNTGTRAVDPALSVPIKPSTPAPRSTRKNTRFRKATSASTSTVRPARTAPGVTPPRPVVQETTRKTAPTVARPPAQPPKASPQTNPQKNLSGGQTTPASGAVRYPVAASPPAVPATTPPEKQPTGNIPSVSEKVSPPQDTAAIYSDPAPTVGETPPSLQTPSAPQLTASSPNTTGTTSSVPQAPAPLPRQPSPVRSIAPDLAPTL